MMKKLSILLMISLYIYNYSQVLITTNSSVYSLPDESAALQIADNNKGFLMPRVANESLIANPSESLTIFNNSTQKINFYTNNRWNNIFKQEDAAKVINVTKNFVSNSTSKTTINAFPSSMPTFTIGSGTSGWTYLNVSTTITVSKVINANLFTVEGMSQIDNTENASSYQFAIGIFVDNQLKVVRKFYAYSTNATCLWKKFNVSGVFENLSIGNHEVKVFAYNLPKMSNDYSNITYGGAASNSCDNLNEDVAKIYLIAQLTE